MKYNYVMPNLLMVVAMFLFSCASTNTMDVQKVKQEQTVKFFFSDGSTDEGIVLSNDFNTLVYVSANSHEKTTVDYDNIRRIEKLDLVYDYQAYQISKAEIDKVKSSRSTWGYTIGGAVIGAAAGILVGIPFWDEVSPLIFSGVGAVTGSIFFGFKGQNKDRENAIEQIRLMRLSESELQKEVDEERKKLKELEEEKKKMQDQLKTKDN